MACVARLAAGRAGLARSWGAVWCPTSGRQVGSWGVPQGWGGSWGARGLRGGPEDRQSGASLPPAVTGAGGKSPPPVPIDGAKMGVEPIPLILMEAQPRPPPPVFPSQFFAFRMPSDSAMGKHLRREWENRMGSVRQEFVPIADGIRVAIFSAHRKPKMEHEGGDKGTGAGAGAGKAGAAGAGIQNPRGEVAHRSGPQRVQETIDGTRECSMLMKGEVQRVEDVGVAGAVIKVHPIAGGFVEVFFKADRARVRLAEWHTADDGLTMCATITMTEEKMWKMTPHDTIQSAVTLGLMKQAGLPHPFIKQEELEHEFRRARAKFEELFRHQFPDRNIMGATSFFSPTLVYHLWAEEWLTKMSTAELKNSILDDQFIAPFFYAAQCYVPMEEGKKNPWQAMLEENTLLGRIRIAQSLMEREVEDHELRSRVSGRVEEKIQDSHRQFVAREQYKALRKELGYDKDEKSALVDKFREKLIGKVVPEAASKVIEEEIDKLGGLEPHSSEFGVTRNYLEWLTAMPWGLLGEEKLSVDPARDILEEDHYGMSDVKQRILEFIAVSNMRGSSKGTILCLHGPPGVGKTSIGKSVAKALGRTFYRFSVGGLGDVAEIKGHRRTYIGAMPGKMMQALKVTGSENPLVLIDEIDKIGSRAFANGGDPSSALLELLDPEQNASFVDHYLDVPVDLSRVLFMCTANSLDTITGPLRDRMEIITLNGYIAEEKVEIAKRFLARQAREKTGLKEGDIVVEDDALKVLVRDYAREAGVRNLGGLMDKVYRKVAFKIVQNREENDKFYSGQGDSFMDAIGRHLEWAGLSPPDKIELPFRVTVDNLETFVGKPTFENDPLYALPPPGVITGLAYTSMGGDVLYIETANLGAPEEPSEGVRGGTGSVEDATENVSSVLEERPYRKNAGSGGLGVITGHLGQVMKESSSIAHTFATAFASQHLPKSAEAVMRHDRLHLHVPSGAIPKDGPSAGVTMVTAMLSTAMGISVRPTLSMTGEVSLTGRVLPVGGIKEKCIAARRHPHVTEVILPRANRKDWDELPEHIKEDLKVHIADTYADVFDVAFPGAPRRGDPDVSAAAAAAAASAAAAVAPPAP